MLAKSILELRKYTVKKIFFELNPQFDFSVSQTIQIAPIFNRTINKIDENTVTVALSVEIKNDEVNELPFHLEVITEGVFVLNNWESDNRISLITNNAVAILFPYLRSIVSTITMNSNIPPYIMPIFNISKVFE